MICSKLLMPLLNGNDYEILPLMRTIEFVIYIKVSKTKHNDEISCLSEIEMPTEYDAKKFSNLYFSKGEYFIAENEHFDNETNSQWKNWKYNDDESNYFASKFILKALEEIYELLTKKNLNNKTLIILTQGIGKNQPYYIWCDPILAKKQLDSLYDQTINDTILISATDVYISELPKANNLFLNENNTNTRYLANQLSLFILKIIDIIKKKIANIN